MAINYFIGRSQAWLEAELAKAQTDLARGSTLSGGGAGDTQVQKEVQVKPETKIERLLYSLYLLDPETYPRSQVNPTRVTVATFRDS